MNVDKNRLYENYKEVVKIKNFMVQCNVANAYTKIMILKKESLYLFRYIIILLINVIIDIWANFNKYILVVISKLLLFLD